MQLDDDQDQSNVAVYNGVPYFKNSDTKSQCLEGIYRKFDALPKHGQSPLTSTTLKQSKFSHEKVLILLQML